MKTTVKRILSFLAIFCLLLSFASCYDAETSDGINESNSVEVTVSQNITTISFSDTTEINFDDWFNTEERYFSIESQENISDLGQFFDFVSENPEVATIEYDEDSWSSNKCIITRVGVGETYVYIQTKDKSIQSEKIKVIVEEEETETETETETEALVEEENNDSENSGSGISVNNNSNSSNSSGSQSSNKQPGGNSQGGGASVVVPDHAESTGNLVWVPVNGGTKYHTHSSCSNMKDPVQVSKETAINNGYTACKRCH